jgi:translation initiation factor 1
MSRPSTKRIPLAGPQVGLQNPFASLDINQSNLPPGPPDHIENAERIKSPGKLHLRRSTAHRGGKVVQVVYGFEPHHSAEDIGTIAATIKSKLGCGGTVSDREVEVQTDDPSRLKVLLNQLGFKL